jgi:hypothetical protein
MKPLLFLDIDGVLNSGAFLVGLHQRGKQANVFLVDPREGAVEHIDPVRIERLNRITEATGASIVLSTSWRCLFGPADTETMLRARGVAAPIVGATPRIYDEPRGHEIATALLSHPGATYVVLDDDHDAGVGHGVRFVHVADGLEDSHVEAAIAVLREEPRT